MEKKCTGMFNKFCRTSLLVLLLLGFISFMGCSSSSDGPVPTGVFTDSPVSGLNYRTSHINDVTDGDGKFKYDVGATVTFSIGDLVLGSAAGAAQLTPLSITPGAAAASDTAVNNKLILLQTLDADGDLNNGIQITGAIRAIVSANAASINFNQETTTFRTSLAALMTALNQANVFSDTDPRARTVRTATAAREHFTRSTSPRIIVETTYGKLRGYEANETTWQFLGIPYAKPPLGDLRWKPPQPLTAWTGVRDAVSWGDQAAQNPAYQLYSEGGMSEDCLNLNIATPKNAAHLPVMVWFHGGAFTILSANSRTYNNPNSLTNKGVVLVTVNHRLGPFGYLAHPLLVADSTYGGSGNYGQMDLIQALKWVKGNIAKFGGNPDNVTIFGESGGGGKVVSLMASPQAAGLFHKAVCMSGTSVLLPDSTNESVIAGAEAIGIALFNHLGLTSAAQARALHWTAIVQSDIDNGISREVYRPTIDYYYMSKTFYNTIKDGQPSDVPFLVGCTSGDYPTLIAGLIDNMPFRDLYSRAPKYVYKFSRVPAEGAAQGKLVGHGGELKYLFNYPSGSDPAWNALDWEIADTTMTMWSNFAKTGNPSIMSLTWPAYTAVNDTYVEIGPTATTVKTGLAAAF
ncbi:MAG: carboxylesterase family protein [Deltaproteobacteria bacterium]|nr:carboxylesterase family protein [Deltaproteobacteria bacterium]